MIPNGAPDALTWALGVIGTIMGWFMWRVDRRLDRVAVALNAFTSGMMIEVLTRRDVPKEVELQAREILRQTQGDS